MKIIKEYMKFDFIEKLFSFIEQGKVNVKIPSTGDIRFNILLNEKVDREIETSIIKLINFTDKIKRDYQDNNIKKLILQMVGFCNMSSGEIAYIDLFSSIYEIFSLNIIRDEEDKFEAEMYNKATNYLFLLDEPDAAFHPEWSRRLIYYVTTFINNLLSGTNKKCQFIITTHSPFMVSDMPSEYVTCIKLNLHRDGTYYRTIKKPKYSFAANIYELLNDGFFMDAPVGEFAQQKIQQILNRINDLDSLSSECLSNEIEYISNIINMVADKLVRVRLIEVFEKKKKILLNTESSNLLEHLLKEIKELKHEILELKKKDYDGEKV